MKIRNLSNQVQELSVVDRSNRSLTYSIYIQAKKDLELEKNLVVLNLITLKSRGILKVLDEYLPPETSEVVREEEKEEDFEEEKEEDSGDIDSGDTTLPPENTDVIEDTEVAETTDDSEIHICPQCGKEFASSRSLTMHINKSHKE